MRTDKSRDVLRTALYTVWAMATLVLLFVVVFLINQMIEQGLDPLQVTVEAQQEDEAKPVSTGRTVREVNLYFAQENSFALGREERRLDLSSSLEQNCYEALHALIEGPRSDLVSVMADDVGVRSVYRVGDGDIVIDFSRGLEVGHPKSAAAEMLFVRSIVATLSQAELRGADEDRVRSVRFLFEGSPPQDSFPTHIDLSHPVTFDSAWLSPATPTRDG